MPIRPVPTPPKMTSPTKRLTRGTAPPAAVFASRPPFTEPFEASLVATVQVVVPAIPKRTSLSVRLPPL